MPHCGWGWWGRSAEQGAKATPVAVVVAKELQEQEGQLEAIASEGVDAAEGLVTVGERIAEAHFRGAAKIIDIFQQNWSSRFSDNMDSNWRIFRGLIQDRETFDRIVKACPAVARFMEDVMKQDALPSCLQRYGMLEREFVEAYSQALIIVNQ